MKCLRILGKVTETVVGPSRGRTVRAMTENAALAARMTELGIGPTQLAKALDISERTVGYWLSGKITWPNEPTRSAVIRLLRVHNARDLGFIQPIRRYLGHESYHTAVVPDRYDPTGEAATNRRDALRAGGMAAAGAVAGGVGGTLHQVFSEPDHMAAALDAGSVSTDRLATLEQTADRLAGGTNTLGKFSLLDETVSTFGTVRRLVRERQRTADQIRLIRTGSKLALVAGELLFDANQFQPAERWYRTARQAALDIGDRYLADVALASQSYVPAYSGDPVAVLDLVRPPLESVRAPSSAVAFLWGVAARAHATLGDSTASRRSLDRSRALLDVAPTDPHLPSVFAFHPKRLAFYETTCCARLRDTHGALAAGDRALRLYAASDSEHSPTESAIVRLDQASALARDGEIIEACRRATAVLTDEHTLPAASVLIRAEEFDALLGDNHSAAVGDWREVLHSARHT